MISLVLFVVATVDQFYEYGVLFIPLLTTAYSEGTSES